MHTEPIIKLLGIKDTHVDGWDSGENEAGLWFERRTAVRKQKCPKCRKKTKRIHGYRWQSIQGSHVGNATKTPLSLHRLWPCLF